MAEAPGLESGLCPTLPCHFATSVVVRDVLPNALGFANGPSGNAAGGLLTRIHGKTYMMLRARSVKKDPQLDVFRTRGDDEQRNEGWW